MLLFHVRQLIEAISRVLLGLRFRLLLLVLLDQFVFGMIQKRILLRWGLAQQA